MGSWADADDGVLALPSGRRLRFRDLGLDERVGRRPEFGVYLSDIDPGPYRWPARWVRWGGGRLPPDRGNVQMVLLEALARCADDRVEIACSGGPEPTGTALACLAVLDGVKPAEAVRLVKEHYENWTVATPWRRLFIGRFAEPAV